MYESTIRVIFFMHAYYNKIRDDRKTLIITAFLAVLVPVSLSIDYSYAQNVGDETDLDAKQLLDDPDAPSLAITTGSESYSQGDTVIINGVVKEPEAGKEVFVRIFDSQDNVIHVEQLPPAEDGSFTLKVPATGSLWKAAGNYTIHAKYGAQSAETNFEFKTGKDGQFNSASINVEFVESFGTKGTEKGEFDFPTGVAVDSKDRIIVSDTNNDRIQIFESNGEFIKEFGSSGNAPGQFNYPVAVTVDSNDRIIVADKKNNRVQVFDSQGILVEKTGLGELGQQGLKFPDDVAVDSKDRIIVGDGGNNNVQIFDSQGIFLTKFGSTGEGNGQFYGPRGVAVDSQDRITVVDTSNERIQIFDSKGRFLSTFGSHGTGEGKFQRPQALAIDSQDRIIVNDAKSRMHIFDSQGNFITEFGSLGSGESEFNGANDIAVDSQDRIIVADSRNNRIQIFTENYSPVARDDSFSVKQNTRSELDVLRNDSDPDNDPLSIDSVFQVSRGKASTDGSFVIYESPEGYVGNSSFIYTVNDGKGGTQWAAVDVRINNDSEDEQKSTLKPQDTNQESDGITISTDKKSYFKGDTVFIIGMVEGSSETVTVTIQDEKKRQIDEITVFSTKDGSFKARWNVSEDLSSGTYIAIANVNGEQTRTDFELSTQENEENLPQQDGSDRQYKRLACPDCKGDMNYQGPSEKIPQKESPEQPITIKTDKSSYSIGSIVTVSGKVNEIIKGHDITVTVTAPNGNVLDVVTLNIASNGKYKTQFDTANPIWKQAGEYTVEATYTVLGKNTETTFRLSEKTNDAKATVNIVEGSNSQGCEQTETGCYTPKQVTIGVGGEVTWENPDSASHTVTSGTPASDNIGEQFDSGLFGPGSTFTHKFEEAGTFDYFCQVHPWMQGTVTVKETPVEQGGDVDDGKSTGKENRIDLRMENTQVSLRGSEKKDFVIRGKTNLQSGEIVNLVITKPDGSTSKRISRVDHGGNFQILIRLDAESPQGRYLVRAQFDDEIKDSASFFVTKELDEEKETPSAFEEVTIREGSSTQGCENTEQGCYIPQKVTIGVGGEVTWENPDSASHTVTSGTPASDNIGEQFDSGLFGPGSTFTHKFEEEGIYDYFCQVHPWMEGTVVVSGQAPSEEKRKGLTLSIRLAESSLSTGDNAQLLISSVPNKNVAVSVIDPDGSNFLSRTITTNINGEGNLKFSIPDDSAVGQYKVTATTAGQGDQTLKKTTALTVKSKQKVRIISVTPSDQQGDPVDSFSKDSVGFVKVVVSANTEIDALITVNLFDNQLASMGVGSIQTTLSEGKTEIVISFFVPESAASGKADVFSNAFTDWISNGGAPLTNEKSNTVEIN